MKTALLVTALLVALPAGAVPAQARSCMTFGHSFDCDEPVRWAPRHDLGEARIAIDTQDGKVTLVLTGETIAFQLSDRTMRKVDRELRRARHEHDEDGNPIGEAIVAAVTSSVRSLLDHSAECPLAEIRDVRCEDGRLVIVSRDGDRLFEKLELDDRDVLDSFDARDAAAFADEFRRLRSGSR